MQKLVAEAERLGHAVFFRSFDSLDIVTIRDDSGHYAIGLDPARLGAPAEARVKLATALGHCETGALYDRADAPAVRRAANARAARWAMDCLLPWEALAAAWRAGDRTPAALAARFRVTEAFAAAALARYAPALPADAPRKEAL